MQGIVYTLCLPLRAVQLTASEERSKRLHLRKSSAADIANDCAIVARMRSIVACNKSLSVDDRLCDIPGTPRDTVYPWGKGAHKQKSEHYRPR